MADQPAGPKFRYDDFIGNVHADPANPQATILLSGFIGRGAAEGTARIYPDPSLGTWYDVPEADILHTLAIPGAPLGGSYVWIKSSAQIKPGSASAAGAGGAPAAAGAPAGQAGAQAAGGAGLGGVLQTNPIVCTQALPTFCGCTPGFDCAGPGPGLQTNPIVCTQGLPTFCGCTPGFDCAPGARAGGQLAGAALPQTNPAVCTQGFPTFCGCTPGFDCPGGGPGGLQTNPIVCTQGFPTFCGCTPGFDCAQGARAAAQPAALPQTHFLCTQGFPTFCGCTPGIDCAGPGPGGIHTQQAGGCTQGLATFCGCTPGLACMPFAQAAAVQPTPSAVTGVCCGTLRTSWFDCHTNVAWCTIRIC
jgi:hypothetical protein